MSQKISIVGNGADVYTTVENCSPYDVLQLYMTSIRGLVMSGAVPPSLVCSALDKLSRFLAGRGYKKTSS